VGGSAVTMGKGRFLFLLFAACLGACSQRQPPDPAMVKVYGSPIDTAVGLYIPVECRQTAEFLAKVNAKHKADIAVNDGERTIYLTCEEFVRRVFEPR
jgi:hypothetical protein